MAAEPAPKRFAVAFAPPAHARPGQTATLTVPGGQKLRVPVPGPMDVPTDGLWYAGYVGDRHIGLVPAPSGAAAAVAADRRAKKETAKDRTLHDLIADDACYNSFNEGFSTDGKPLAWSARSKQARRSGSK